MKLTDIETFVVGNPPPHFGGRYFVFVKITTDCGISGIGQWRLVFCHQTFIVPVKSIFVHDNFSPDVYLFYAIA